MAEFVFPAPLLTKKQKVELLQEIIRPKCAELLRENGFVSYKNEDLSWYRIFNGEVLQAVYFYSGSPRVPLMLRFVFGCHPLFLEPLIPHPFSDNGRKLRTPNEMFEMLHWSFSLNLALKMNENGLILSLPNHGEAVMIEKYLLPLLNKVKTEKMAYERHKEIIYKSRAKTGLPYSNQVPFRLAEEAVYMGDEELYPLCRESALREQEYILCDYDALMKVYADQMLEYFETGDRAKYMQLMEERKQNTLKLLKKKLNI